jgi:filamentous hemagglutinin family protein
MRQSRRAKFKLWWAIRVATASACAPLFVHPSFAWAMPTDGRLTGGQATWRQEGKNFIIRQGTDRAAIDWTKFDVAKRHQVRFYQPNKDSVTLNRVTGFDPSIIQGTLSATGNVYLINPHGVVIGKGARIDAGGFLVSTLDVSPQEFMGGGDLTFAGDSNARIVNLGKIEARSGDVVVIAREIRNDGTISAPTGTVAMGAGSEVILYKEGETRLGVRTGTGQIVNAGTIEATAAQLEAVGGNVYALAINNEGVIRANTVDKSGGKIMLRAKTGVVENSGQLIARGEHENKESTGGEVVILADNIELTPTSVIDVSGPAGGGSVQVGTDVKPWASIPETGSHTVPGSVPGAENASAVIIAPGALINANARLDGIGGNVVIWSDEFTNFHGNITAHGGRKGGSGGWVETSSKNNLQAFGFVGARASGRRKDDEDGSWLLDPTDITITGNSTNGSFGGGNPNIWTPNNLAASSNVSASVINSSLSGDTSVTINTASAGSGSGNIDVSADIIKSGNGGAATLRLNAVNNINVYNAITSTSGQGALTVILNADSDASGSGAVYVGNSITTFGGDITIGGGANPATTAAFGNTARPDGVLIANSAILNAGAGSISIRGTGINDATGNAHGVEINNGAKLRTTSGAITVIGQSRGSGTYNNGVLVSGGGTEVSATGGHIVLTGSSTGTGVESVGMGIWGGSTVTNTGSGNITVTATGSTNGSATERYGIYLDGTTLSVVDGTLSVSGTSGAGSSGTTLAGIHIDGATNLLATGTGSINLTGSSSTTSGALNAGIIFTTRWAANTSTVRVNSGTLTINATATAAGQSGLRVTNSSTATVRAQSTSPQPAAPAAWTSTSTAQPAQSSAERPPPARSH